MPHPLKQYVPDNLHPNFRSSLLVSPPEAVPSINDLETTQQELLALKQRALERSAKAAKDLETIEQEMKKLRDMEKGKQRAQAYPLNRDRERVKREPSYTPSLDQDERQHSPSIPPSSAGAASTSTLPASNTPSFPQKIPQGGSKPKKKDKKRKRDDESEPEADMPRGRKPSPLPPTAHQSKTSKVNNSSHLRTPAADWSLTGRRFQVKDLLPQSPISVPSLPAGPRKPIEVKEDFSKAKAPTNQVPITTFYSSVDPYLRQIREEDLGWLEYDGDTVGPYVVPELGRHYTEQWEDEDIALYHGVPASLDFTASRTAAAQANQQFIQPTLLPKWDTTTISESDFTTDKGLGPVAERLTAAMIMVPVKTLEIKQAEEAYEARMAASGSKITPLPKEKVLVGDFEERVKDTLRFYGLLDAEPDFSNSVDDPVSSALRTVQRQLRQVSALNKARRQRLAAIARDRLAYQEYVDAREALDKNITAAYAKLQKKDGPKAPKKNKKKGDSGTGGLGMNGGQAGVNGAGGVMPLPNPAALGLGPDEDMKLVVPESLKHLVELRAQWVEVVGGAYEEEERQNPGRIRGVPQRSIYEGVEEDVRRELARSSILPSASVVPNGASGTSVNGANVNGSS